MTDDKRIRVTTDGPYIVSGSVPLGVQRIVAAEDGECACWAEGDALHAHERYALCRCGSSDRKPFCDGSHAAVCFDGTETASRRPVAEQADFIEGPNVGLLDVVPLCADARFCHRERIWSLAPAAETAEDIETVRRDAALCPSGRYTAFDPADGGRVEPDLPPSIGLVEDPSAGVSGPIWVRGGIPVESADGSTYEVRNRVTLCRCGATENKPFCDGSHVEVGFRAE